MVISSLVEYCLRAGSGYLPPMTLTIPHAGRRGYQRPKLLLAVLPNQFLFVID